MRHWFILPWAIILTPIWALLALLPTIAAADDWAAVEQAAGVHEFARAVEMATKLIAEGETSPEIFYQRGRWNFRLGYIDQSLADFDRFISQRPKLASRLWERGITCYYAKKFVQGSKQFEQYQTYHSNDVENAVWRYLCQAQVEGREKARQAMLPIRFDSRIPMMEVYDLFRAKVKPDTVLQRLKAANSQGDVARKQRFNAHLYLALFHDSEGDLAAAQKHIDVAVKQYQQGDYMWAVAKHQQQDLRRRAQESKTPMEVPKKVQLKSG